MSLMPVKPPPMSDSEQYKAKLLFQRWFSRYPDIPNPTDVNKQEKFNFVVEIGWPQFSLMQQTRKGNIKEYGYPFPWTKAEYWVEKETPANA